MQCMQHQRKPCIATDTRACTAKRPLQDIRPDTWVPKQAKQCPDCTKEAIKTFVRGIGRWLGLGLRV